MGLCVLLIGSLQQLCKSLSTLNAKASSSLGLFGTLQFWLNSQCSLAQHITQAVGLGPCTHSVKLLLSNAQLTATLSLALSLSLALTGLAVVLNII